MTHSKTSKPTILIIEDEEQIRILIQKVLNRYSFETILASDGDEAMEFIRGDIEIAAVISDIQLPGTNGMDVLVHLRREKPELPVILMTGFWDKTQYSQAMQKGAFEYLPKPFDINDLLKTVTSAVDAYARATGKTYANIAQIASQKSQTAPPTPSPS